MKTNILLLIIVWAALSSCSKDTSEPSSVKSDYRDPYTGRFSCEISRYLYLQGKPLASHDTIAIVNITKEPYNDSAMHLSYDDMSIAIKANGVFHYYNGYDPNRDSLGYIDSDSIYLNYVFEASIGGRDWMELKGKKL